MTADEMLDFVKSFRPLPHGKGVVHIPLRNYTRLPVLDPYHMVRV